MGTRRLLVTFIVAIVAGLVGAGCGGSDDSSSANPVDAATATDQAADQSADDTEAESDADPDAADDASTGGGSAPQLAEGPWEGTLHVEVSGDVDFSEDYFGAGSTQGTFTIFSFSADDGSGAQIAFTAGSNDEAALMVSSSDFVGGGEIGDGKVCNLTLSKNDGSSAEGRVVCKDAEGLNNSGTEGIRVDIEGTFAMTQP